MANTHHTGIPRLQWAGAYPPCIPSVTISCDLNPFCPSDTVTFTPTLSCVTDVVITAYAWVVNGSIQSTSVDPFVTTTLVDGDSVYLLFVTSVGNTYYSNVVTVAEKAPEDCTPPVVEGLELTFDDIANVPVADAASLTDWNTFFDLPTNGTPFTSVSVVNDVVTLFGGANIHLKDDLFYFGVGSSDNLLKILDKANVVISAGMGSLRWNQYLNEVSLPVITSMGDDCCHGVGLGTAANTVFTLPLLKTIGYVCFGECNFVTALNLPSLLTVGWDCFQYVGASTSGCTFTLTAFDGMCGFMDCINPIIIMPNAITIGGTVGFNNVFGADAYPTSTVHLTIPVALMTCNGGNPDGDIEWIQDPLNSVTATIVTV